MRHLEPINRKAGRIEAHVEGESARARGESPDVVGESARASAEKPDARKPDVVALQQGGDVHIPLGCSLVFSPGWEADSSGGTAGLCQPVERDLFDCHLSCFWPAHVPDLFNLAPDWTGKCANAQQDWRQIDLIFP